MPATNTGGATARSIGNWLNARVLLNKVEVEAIANAADRAALDALLKQKTYVDTFSSTYLGDKDGAFTMWPQQSMP